jgi:hypothetical protein
MSNFSTFFQRSEIDLAKRLRVVTTRVSPSLANSSDFSNSGRFDETLDISSEKIFSHPLDSKFLYLIL